MTSLLLKKNPLSEGLANMISTAKTELGANRGKKIIKRNRIQIQSHRSQNELRFAVARLDFKARSEDGELYHAIGEAQKVRLADCFVQEGGIQPTSSSRVKTRQVIEVLYENQRLLPARIGASREGGIMLVYRFPDEQTIEVEIENDLLISCVASDKTSVLSSEVFKPVLDACRFVRRTRTTSQTTIGV